MFEELESALTLDASDYIRSADRAANASDDLGDEVEEAGDRAFGASAGFVALRASTTGLGFSLGALTAAGTSTVLMLGGLATAIGAVTLALAPLAIGAAAVGAAFGLIVGSGIYAGMSELQKAFKSARKEIAPMIKELGERFVPFLKETIQMLPGLAKSLLDAIGPLDPFLSALRTMRDTAIDILPSLVEWFMDLGRWALPILTKIGAFVVNKVIPALKQLVNWGTQVWETVQNWVQQFRRATKRGTSLRKKVTRLITAAKNFWKNLQPVINALKPFVKQLIRIAPVVAGLALDILTLATNIGAKLLPYLVPLINIVTRLVKWFNNLAPPVKQAILVAGGLYLALGALSTVFGVVAAAIVSVIGSISLIGIAIAGLIAGIVLLADYVYKNWDQIVKWTKSLASDIKWWMGRIGRWISNNIMGPVNDLISWLKTDAKSDIIGVFDSIASGIGNAFKGAFNSAIPSSVPIPSVTIGAGQPGPDITLGGGTLPLPQLDTGGYIEGSGLAMLHAGERVMPAAQVDKGEAESTESGSSGPEQIVIQLDSDATKEIMRGEAVDAIDERVADVRRRQKRRGEGY